MKEIIALKEYTDKYVSLYEGEIRNIENNLADRLITQEIVAEHSDSSSGGGGAGITLLATKEYDINTTSTTAETIEQFEVEGSFTSEALIWCRVVDTAGPRVGYFYGTNSFFYAGMPAVAGSPSQSQMDMYPGGQATIRYTTAAGGGECFSTNSASLNGVYVQTISPSGVLTVSKKYSEYASATVDGHYRLDVFRIELPNGEPILPGEAIN